jgi:rsbT co-antagonist protein RsbR
MNSLQLLRTEADQQKQLDTSFVWLIGGAAVSFVGCGILWLSLRQAIVGLIEALNLAFLLSLFLARLLLSRGKLQVSVAISSAVMIVGSCVLTAAAPETLPMMVLVPPLMAATFLPYINNRTMLHTSVVALIFELTLVVLARMAPLRLPVPPEVELVIVPLVISLLCGVLLIMLWQFHGRITRMLDVAEQANTALQQAHADLEDQVLARTADLRNAMSEIEQRERHQVQLLVELKQQRNAIRELSIPVLPVTHNSLVMPLIGAIDTARIQQIHDQALQSIERAQASRLLIDVTGVPVIDTQVAQGIIQTMQATRLLGAEAILVGIRPEVAQTIVNLGVDLSGVRTYPDLETALSR